MEYIQHLVNSDSPKAKINHKLQKYMNTMPYKIIVDNKPEKPKLTDDIKGRNIKLSLDVISPSKKQFEIASSGASTPLSNYSGLP